MNEAIDKRVVDIQLDAVNVHVKFATIFQASNVSINKLIRVSSKFGILCSKWPVSSTTPIHFQSKKKMFYLNIYCFGACIFPSVHIVHTPKIQ